MTMNILDFMGHTYIVNGPMVTFNVTALSKSIYQLVNGPNMSLDSHQRIVRSDQPYTAVLDIY